MKYILSFLFICVAVQCIQADEDRLKLLKKMRKTVSTVKNMVEKAKEEKMRKLQQSTDEGGDTIPLNTIPAEIPANSPVIAPAKPVDPSTVEPLNQFPLMMEIAQQPMDMQSKNSIISKAHQMD